MKNDGGPAFPLPEGKTWPGQDTHGMSLRDYFAGEAVTHAAVYIQGWENDTVQPHLGVCAKNIARVAYAIADAMLAERAK